MKVKWDFVTNSSSTCFFVKMETDASNKLEFVENLNEYFADLHARGDWLKASDVRPSVALGDIEELSPNLFIMEGGVPYFSDYDDLPKHIKYLVLDYLNNRNGLAKFGIKNLEFEIKDMNDPKNK